MSQHRILALALLALLAGGRAGAAPIFTGPVPYRSTGDIPLGFYAGGGPVVLEDFEDGTLDFGLVASTGIVVLPGSITDSVDADDGVIDGSGLLGHSFFSGSGLGGITITFPITVTAAGMVWTDGFGTTTFEVFGPGMVSLGTVDAAIADGVITGTTGDDHFFGVQDAGGIVAIRLSNTWGGIEIDHIQHGTVPEPATGFLFATGIAGLAARGRRRAPACRG